MDRVKTELITAAAGTVAWGCRGGAGRGEGDGGTERADAHVERVKTEPMRGREPAVSLNMPPGVPKRVAIS